MARIIFAGSPDFAVPSLTRLIASQHEVVAVLTQPDRPSGRGRRLTAGPVKVCAEKNGLPVYQPVRLGSAAVQTRLTTFAPDLMIVVAYGLILPPAVLALPGAGCINVHASLLPRWRGAAPIQAALLAGDRQTGISLMQMAAGLDTGPVFALQQTDIGAGETAGELHDRLAELGADLLARCVDPILAGALRPDPQGEAGVTYAARISKADALIDWSRPAVELERQVRAYNPWPVAETVLDGERMRCWRSDAVADKTGSALQGLLPPGRIVAVTNDGIEVSTGCGILRILELQMPGRRRVTAGDFARGHDIVGKLLS
ncbi:MAG: methionyl-tRNA formyltransferase [Gammaproteobacteria bacterium]|jgi:methionyl-tRNA formyltransferase|nr:methionyl-tRNA formyltransferase [Chromatiales bacterium]MCP4924370.1 methionyl-tRNA formyltransferase [Gammaproteobacteria bacterium]MDP7153496.1 methionyl-tRNA formyltransferase [Gammaproteobacteria bacterium]MDP7295814.1 methionyl-tRNA formyltransferase [Gammaproteobacteria bacterium]MDP7419744.1 methionyl-tRNA formyltransferase [Gammaproteobacteria bacterium]